jgi:hypothetical protein
VNSESVAWCDVAVVCIELKGKEMNKPFFLMQDSVYAFQNSRLHLYMKDPYHGRKHKVK